jgi:hypothetical protein
MRTISTFSVLVPAVLQVLVGCGSDGPTGPTTGEVRVSVTTVGADIDADGFTVIVDDMTSRPLQPDAPATISGLSPGPHVIELADVADNCTVDGSNTASVSVVVGEEASTSFFVTCDAVVAGHWSYVLSVNLGVPCTITEQLNLTQIKSSFRGSASNGWIVCPAAGIDERFAGAAVTSGVSNRSSVEFDFDNSLVHHTGAYAGNTMNGSVVFQFPEGTLNGSWTATRTASLSLARQEGAGESGPTGLSALAELADRIRRLRP